PTIIQSVILKAVVQTDERLGVEHYQRVLRRGRRLKDQSSKEARGLIIRGRRYEKDLWCGTLSKSVEKRKETEGPIKQRGSWSDNKRAKNPRNNENQAKGRALNVNAIEAHLIPFGHGSSNVIVGMDWLSKHKAEIVFHEKVLRIPLASGKVLPVQGE
nr:putative reverse transcriptase domain-containing protein [Tanacetum cinerariifolium]